MSEYSDEMRGGTPNEGVPKIVDATIKYDPQRPYRPRSVNVLLEGNEKWIDLFTFFADELSFTKEEFIGKTVSEALALHRERDIAYLRS